MVEEVTRGSLGVADVRQGPGDDDPIQARQDARDLLGMSFDEVNHGQARGWRMSDPFSPERKTVWLKKQNLFGSGYAGLGSGTFRLRSANASLSSEGLSSANASPP